MNEEAWAGLLADVSIPELARAMAQLERELVARGRGLIADIVHAAHIMLEIETFGQVTEPRCHGPHVRTAAKI